MPTLVQPLTSPIGVVDPQRVEDALVLISPKWTTWSVQTLAQQCGPMRIRDIAARLPFVSEQLVSKRLAQMHADGLVTRTDDRFGSPYQLSAFGAALTPVHQALAHWSRDHLALGRMADAERVEDAVRRLYLRHSTAVIQTLCEGPMRFVRLAEPGLDNNHAGHRLVRLQLDGLVARTGPRHGDPYVLTGAGRALGPVFAAVEHWSDPVAAARHPADAPVVAATRTNRAEAASPSEGIRASAALRRSTAVSGGLFSHAPQPQPRVATDVTARSAPVRSR